MDKKKAAATAVATTIAASSAAVGATFDEPADILQNTYHEPVVEFIDMDAGPDDGGQTEDESKGRQMVSEAKGTFSEWILELPLLVRTIFVVPMWFLGNMIIYAGQLAVTALSPFWQGLLHLLILALALTAAFAVTAKVMFPDVPLKKILNRKNFRSVLIASVLVFGVDLALKLGWPEYLRYRMPAVAALTLLVLFFLVVRFGSRETRRRRKVREQAELFGVREEDLVYESLGQTFTIRRPDANN